MEPPELENPPSRNMQEERSDEDASDHDSEEEECDVAEMKKTRSKSLVEFRFRVEEAIRGNYLLVRKKEEGENAEDFRDIRLWGVPLLPSHGHEGTDTVLMKFLKAKRYKVHEAFTLLRKNLKWRGDFRPDEVVGEEFRPGINDLWFTSGRDKIGRPLCYIILGKEWQKKMLSTEEYLRWRVVCLEKGIQNLRFRPGGVDSLVQIIDLKNSPGTASKEVKLICKRIITMHQDNYPALVYKNANFSWMQLIINVPSWFMALNTLNLRLITQKSRNKFIFVKSSKVTETLLKYATAENLLVEYGGLKRENDNEFSTDDKVLEVNIRPGTTELIQIPANEVEVTVTWDMTVVGYEVGYKEEFVPDDDCSYIVLIQEKKMLESVRNSFHIREPGKIVITIVNGAYTKKKAFYRPLFLIYKYQQFSVAASHHLPHKVCSLLFLLSPSHISEYSFPHHGEALPFSTKLTSAARGAPGNRASAKLEVSMLENHLIASKGRQNNNLRRKEGRGSRTGIRKLKNSGRVTLLLSRKEPLIGLTMTSFLLAGKSGGTSAMRGLPVDVIATAYQISREEAERLKLSRRETIIFGGSERCGRGGVASA
ncbi:UNVERIFIED_CONTAM: Patellin-4 [Sesamum radiatum]|uniref:Patellin-4 n=1 Tax=Sesamum radiatum TaxID=300843 RepID=A0AAW2UUN4_SESRA